MFVKLCWNCFKITILFCFYHDHRYRGYKSEGEILNLCVNLCCSSSLQPSQWREKDAFSANIATVSVCCQTPIWIKTKSYRSLLLSLSDITHPDIPSTLWQYLAVRSYSMWSANDVNFSLSCIFWMFDVAKMGNIYHVLAIINENSSFTVR